MPFAERHGYNGMKCQAIVYTVKIHPWVARFAKEYCFPGWYIDTNGCYGCLLGKYWISVFVNDCDKTLDITVDTVGESGYLDKNLEWETAEDDATLAETARRLMSQYAATVLWRTEP